MPPLHRSAWTWALLGLLTGMTLIALLPSQWLYLTPPDPTKGDAAVKDVWACPMLCVKLEGPGSCPVCGMDLEKLEDTGDALSLNARERRLIDLRTHAVDKRVLTRHVRTFGRLTLNQRRVQRITAWIPGRITRLFADTVYTDVRAGDHLFEIYSPELYAAQSEYLSARQVRGPAAADDNMVRSAGEKLRLYGLTQGQIETLEQRGVAQHTMVINAPLTGTIFEQHLREGDYVKEGSALYTIADDSTLWLLFDIYESDLPWISLGQDVEVRLQAKPGEVRHGTIEFIDRAVHAASRTIRVRAVLDNQDHDLKPGMFADVTVIAVMGPAGGVVGQDLKGRYSCYMHPEIHRDEPGDCPVCGMPVEIRAAAPSDNTPVELLAVPRSAVLDLGERQLVYVMAEPPQWREGAGGWEEESPAVFQARDVTLGVRTGEWIEVRAGLDVGERVVTQGAMMIDSQLELLGKPSLIHTAPSTARDHSHH